VPNAPERLAALIDEITTIAPQTLLVVAQIVPTRAAELDVEVQAFNSAIPAIVSERGAAGRHVALVDLHAAFTAHADYETELLYDGLHPNYRGYEVMAQAWYAAVAEFLPARP
jgi:lysophospholipase L1-like esterase